MRVLVACEYSGRVRDAFTAQGHSAMSCDFEPTETPGEHFRGDVLTILSAEPWDLIIAHPPCTYLTNSGVAWFYKESVANFKTKAETLLGEDRWNALDEAAYFFRQLLAAPCQRIAVENPIPHKYAVQRIGRKYDQLIQPWQFGHGETKATCLWLKGLPKLQPTNIVDGRVQRSHYLSPGPERWKERSRTYQGIADAMAAQWGSL